jgi:uncharacterized membrane protein
MDYTPSVPPAPPSTPAPPAGGGRLSPTDAFGGGWNAFVANPWVSIGVCLVLGAILLVGQMIPFVNLLFGLLVSPALYAGGAWFFLRGIRGENPPFETAFEGFQRWPAVTGALLITFGVTLVLIIPAIVMLLGTIGVMALLSGQTSELEKITPAMTVPLLLTIAVTYPAMMWWTARSYFTMFTIMEADRPTAMEAVRRSFALTRGSLWRLIALWLLSIPVVLLGCLALCVGIVPALIVIYYAMAHAYEQLRARTA